ncbi:DUF5995 family protein [Aureispira anguillae]|uniref:DUF5995 family protein n=1 Tax=Aureispira anguillae TaxID=2864201 RepID=A0A916DSV4_9BACT|nr:DUF5995 family protein [Aureispira anguillae]BDS11395.1 DUF5995 family protein [Aureispira anguillae]
MKVTTIDGVIGTLDEIIENAKKTRSPKGYFAALYQKVTKRVKEGIEEGAFENAKRMEKLDVLFANRYLEAQEQYFKGQEVTESWKVAFDATRTYWPIVLQHLLLGINAHINLDLGIAAVETMISEQEPITALKKDFDKINKILEELVGEVEQELSAIWPTLKCILTYSGKIDDFLINFSMEKAREGAWKFATELAAAQAEERASMIMERDAKIANVATYINPPGLIPKLIFGMIRIGERGDVVQRIKILT